jgi:SAM-dependent methyltransferase
MNTLQEDLDLVTQLFDYEGFINKKMTSQQVKRYFQMTAFFYRQFHSKQGAMHFPLYLEGGADNHYDALHTQANYISSLIETHQLTRSLEIGCGMGFNSLLLAKKHPHTKFKGLDPALSHLRFARKKSKGIANLSYAPGDWHEPTYWTSPSDLMYAVESFCYITDLEKVLQSIAQNLDSSRHFVVFDAFCLPQLEESIPELKQAIQLSAAAFAVKAWWNVEEVIIKARKQGLKLVSKQDLSNEVMPNLLRFQKDTRALFQKKWFQYLLKNRLLPNIWIGHLIGGLLGAHTLGSKAQGYFYLHFQKEN